MMTGLDAVFAPRRIALVGASGRVGSVGRLLWNNLAGFPGEVVAVGSAEAVAGRTGYRDLADVPGEIDLAVIAVPAAAVPGVMRAAAAKGVAAAVVLSAGFAETGSAGSDLQQEILRIGRAGGVRLVGPNCFGVQNSRLPMNASIAAGGAAADHRRGISLVTQSGAYGMAVHALGRDERVPFAKVYAAGNKADIADHEIIGYLADDPDTAVICLMLESISQPRAFLEQARRAAARKPVIATVTGRTEAGRRAALSHTASLATDDALRDALLRQASVIRTRTGLQMLDAAKVLVGQPVPAGPRVGIVTNSGGVGVELADLLVDEGLRVPVLGSALQERLRAILPEYAGTANPVDMTPVWAKFSQWYPAIIDALARSGEVDIVVPVLLQRSASVAVATAVNEAVAGLRRDGVGTLVAVCWVAPRDAQPGADLLQAAGVPCLPWPERTAQALGVAVRSASATAAAAAAAAAANAVPAVGVPAAAVPTNAVVAEAPAIGSGRRPPLVPVASGDPYPAGSPGGLLAQRDLLASWGIRLAPSRRCATAEDVIAAAAAFGYPVVLKVDHPRIQHKSDVGGVRIGIVDAGSARRAAHELLALAPGAAVVVQHQHDGLEVMVGGVRKPEFGELVMVGLGGIGAELIADTRFALAPITPQQADDLWRSLRNAAVLDGFRGRFAVDVDALSGLAALVGDLMVARPDLAEIDLNPVLAGPDGYLAVDWRVFGDFLPSDGEPAG
jgi:acyl-CoA synthetase (NDP forming)